MRSIRFVCLLVLAFSTLAAADSIDFQGAGSLAAGTAFTQGAIAAGRTWEVGDRLLQIFDLSTHHSVVGNLGTVDVLTGTLFSCSVGLCFTGGFLDIDNIHGKDLFFGSIVSGSITHGAGTTILSAILPSGGLSIIRNDTASTFSSQALVTSRGVLVAEPASLTLFGIGLVAMGFLKRRWTRLA